MIILSDAYYFTTKLIDFLQNGHLEIHQIRTFMMKTIGKTILYVRGGQPFEQEGQILAF